MKKVFTLTLILCICLSAFALAADYTNARNAKYYGAVGDGTTDNRSILNTLANTTLSAGGTIVFPAGAYLINSAMTFPINVNLVFETGAMFKAPDAVAVNINGQVLAAPDQQIFSWAGTGHFTFGGVDCTTTCSQSSMMIGAGNLQRMAAFYPQWWGVKGDWNNDTQNGTDDAPAWQKLLDVLPNYSRVVLLPNMKFRLNTGINLFNRTGVVIESVHNAGADTDSPAGSSTMFIWQGADGGTVLALGKVRGSLFKNFTIIAGPGGATTSGADIGILLSQNVGFSGNISSDNTFSGVTVAAFSRRPTFTGVYIGDVTGDNNEYHTFTHCIIYASNTGEVDPPQTGTGVYLAHANVKQITFDNNVIAFGRYGIHNNGGSFISRGGKMGYSQTAYYLQSWSDKIVIDGDDTENLVQLIKVSTGAQSAPITVMNGRYDRTFALNATAFGQTGNEFIELGTGGAQIILANNYFGGWRHDVTDASDWFTNHNKLLKGGNGANLVWTNNIVADFYSPYLYQQFLDFSVVIKDGQLLATNTTSGHYAGIDVVTSAGGYRRLAGIQQNTGELGTVWDACAADNLCFGDGAIEITGITTPQARAGGGHGLYVRVFGTTGATRYDLSIVAVDAAGKKTRRLYPTAVVNANATLSGSNYLALDFPAVPGAASYDIIQRDPVGAGYRLVANVANNTTYLMQANPAGAFTYTLPTTNETQGVKTRGALTVTDRVTGTPTKFACFTSAGVLVESATACQ